MATVDEDLRTFLLADSTVAKYIGTRIHQNEVPKGKSGVAPILPYVWFAKSDDTGEDALTDSAGTAAYNNVYDLECWGQSPRQANELKNAVRSRLHLARGTFGAGTVQGVFVTGQGADYQPKGIGEGVGGGYHGEAILVDVKGHA